MASLTKTFVSPDIVLQNLEAITACSSRTKACTETTWSSVVLWTAAMGVRGNNLRVLPDRIQDVHWPSKRHSGRPRAKCSRSCPFWNTNGVKSFITVNPKDPKKLADFEDLQSPPVDLLVQGPSSYTPCSSFSSHICDDLGDRRDALSPGNS